MVRFPRISFPFSNPVRLTKLRNRLFGVKKVRKFTLKKLGKWILIFIGLCIFSIIILFAWFAKDLPTPGKIITLAPTSSTRLFDRNGKPLYTISNEQKRIIVESKDIPDVVRHATIAIEDKNFYNHIGIDAKGLARAVIFGGNRGGGSTITQQYVKNAVLKDNKRKIVRKVKEAILAIELEIMYSKDEILTMYLNQIGYGGSIYGIEAAAQSYFGKSAKELTVVEAATLAALPQAPTTLSPYGTNTDRLIARRNLAIDNMVDLGYIKKEEADTAKKTKLSVKPKRDSIVAPHFVMYVKEWLIKFFAEQLGDEQLADQKLNQGGFNVTTTIDLDKQKLAEETVKKYADTLLKSTGATNAGLVAIDPRVGEIQAMVGSIDYFNEKFGAFNIATAKRQPGSSFKPIVYAASFKEGYNPATTIFDVKTDFGGNYVPQNYDSKFRGPVTIRQALGNSLNIPAVKVLALTGNETTFKTVEDLGITTLKDKQRYGLSLVLGGGEVMLTEMAQAYGVFATNGKLVPVTPILNIKESGGKEIYKHEPEKLAKQVLAPEIAYQITDILADVNAKRPMFGRLLGNLTLPGRVVAVKTGTTNSIRDAWTIGYTPQLVTAVWAGNNDNTPMNRGGGSVAAAPIWAEYMRKALADVPAERFTKPNGLQTISVDRLSNKLPVEGSEVIKDIFAKWQIPKDKDDFHLTIRVCRENGLIAQDDIPDELTEERTFLNIRSERPTVPAWEVPVQQWLKENNLINPPPKENCQLNSLSQPTVTITSPTSGSTVSGTFTISATASATSGVKSVDFYIDDTAIFSDNNSPYQTTYNASNLSNGSHTIKAVVISKNGSTTTTTVSVISTTDSQAPADVSNLLGIPGPGANKVTLTWDNPSDTDFASVKIYVYIDSTSTLVKTETVLSPTDNTIISGLNSSVAYKFLVKSVDTSLNESGGTFVILTPF
ncbi:transglycosylase domain-containing protein [Candidatus Berkelbacteria bacterium]|nr:transglycosylase domain-containing protein [Candidatus Berkelbacteria bacterium]